MDFGNQSDELSTGGTNSDFAASIQDVMTLLKAQVLCCPEKLDDLIYTACGCDLMSDVLTSTSAGSILLTGLTNSQVVRTAEILDLKAIIFVRNKKPDASTLNLAIEIGIPLLTSPYPLFESCGLLYTMGLKGCTKVD